MINFIQKGGVSMRRKSNSKPLLYVLMLIPLGILLMQKKESPLFDWIAGWPQWLLFFVFQFPPLFLLGKLIYAFFVKPDLSPKEIWNQERLSNFFFDIAYVCAMGTYIYEASIHPQGYMLYYFSYLERLHAGWIAAFAALVLMVLCEWSESGFGWGSIYSLIKTLSILFGMISILVWDRLVVVHVFIGMYLLYNVLSLLYFFLIGKVGLLPVLKGFFRDVSNSSKNNSADFQEDEDDILEQFSKIRSDKRQLNFLYTPDGRRLYSHIDFNMGKNKEIIFLHQPDGSEILLYRSVDNHSTYIDSDGNRYTTDI